MRQLGCGGIGVLLLVLGLCGSAAAQDRPVPIGELTGRITDAVSGAPLGTAHAAMVELERCNLGVCRPLRYIPVDDQGFFRDTFVPRGYLRVSFSALDHERVTFDTFVEIGEITDLGAIALSPVAYGASSGVR